MVSAFDLDKLNALLKDFYAVTKIRITVFDDEFLELTAWPEHIPAFCRLVRTDPAARAACFACDRRACRVAAHQHNAYTYRCHAGLTESIMPLYYDNLIVGYLFFGHVFPYPDYETGLRQIFECCRDYRLEPAALEKACRELPILSAGFVEAASHLLQAVAIYLCAEHMAVLEKEPLARQLDDYLEAHFAEPLEAADLCRELHIGKTRLYELAEKNYGMGVAERIRRLRIDRARRMLAEQPDLHISEVAAACGFGDYNYFNTVFKRLAGVPPCRYRKEHAYLFAGAEKAPR